MDGHFLGLLSLLLEFKVFFDELLDVLSVLLSAVYGSLQVLLSPLLSRFRNVKEFTAAPSTTDLRLLDNTLMSRRD